jgi:hypothetical protein
MKGHIMRLAFAALLLFVSLSTFGEPEVDFTFGIEGRAPLVRELPDSPGYGLVGAAVFAGDPIVLTADAFNVPEEDRTRWRASIEWVFVSVKNKQPIPQPVVAPWDGEMRPTRVGSNAFRVGFQVSGLPPGEYIVRASCVDPVTASRIDAEDRRLSVYRGDESIAVKREFLRHRGKAELAKGTRPGYEAARSMLLEAARDNTDPSVYESLADASAPWAPPEETASYYERSTTVVRQNLERRFGERGKWPAKAVEALAPYERKQATFQEMIPYYKANFEKVRIVVQGGGRMSQPKFVVERRSDGARIRTVDVRR